MMIEERFLLAKDRIKEIKSETGLRPEFQEYFVKTAGFLELIIMPLSWTAVLKKVLWRS